MEQLADTVLEILTSVLPITEKVFFLKPRRYTLSVSDLGPRVPPLASLQGLY